MTRVAKIYSWTIMALLIVSVGVLYRMNPNIVGPYSFVPLLPYATALLVFHAETPRWFVVLAIILNGVVAFIGLVVGVAAMFFAEERVLAPALLFALFVAPAALNVRALLRHPGQEAAVPVN